MLSCETTEHNPMLCAAAPPFFSCGAPRERSSKWQDVEVGDAAASVCCMVVGRVHYAVECVALPVVQAYVSMEVS